MIQDYDMAQRSVILQWAIIPGAIFLVLKFWSDNYIGGSVLSLYLFTQGLIESLKTNLIGF